MKLVTVESVSGGDFVDGGVHRCGGGSSHSGIPEQPLAHLGELRGNRILLDVAHRIVSATDRSCREKRLVRDVRTRAPVGCSSQPELRPFTALDHVELGARAA